MKRGGFYFYRLSVISLVNYLKCNLDSKLNAIILGELEKEDQRRFKLDFFYQNS